MPNVVRSPKRSSRCHVGSDGSDKIDSVYRDSHAVDRSEFPGKLRYAQSFGAGSHQNRSASVPIRGQGEGEFDRGAWVDRLFGVEIQTGPRDVSKMSRVEFRRTTTRSANLQRQIYLIPPGFPALTHGSPLEGQYWLQGSCQVPYVLRGLILKGLRKD